MIFQPPPSRSARRGLFKSLLLASACLGAPLADAAAAGADDFAAALSQADRPTTPEAGGLLNLGANLTKEGDFATAEIAYRQVLSRNDFAAADQRTALLGLAHMFRKWGAQSGGQAGALTKAAAILEKFVTEFPDDPRVPDAYLELGRTLRDLGAYSLALTRFYSVINSTLKLPAQGFEYYTLLAKTAQFEIAQTYYESGDYAEAGKYFDRVRLLDLAPADRARAHFMAGCAEERANELDAAIVTMRAFLEQWPNNENIPEARSVLAMALNESKRPQEAMAVTLDLLRAESSRVASDPKSWSYWQRRTGNSLANDFFQNGAVSDALTIYQTLLGLSSDPSWTLPVNYQIALCYERLYQVDRARAAYQAIIDAGTAKAGSPAPTPDIAELAQMATWRLGHLQWRDSFNQRMTTLLAPGNPEAPVPAAGGSSPPSG